MKTQRKLDQDVWYKVQTAINVGEPVFQLWWAVILFYRVLCDAKKRFNFEICDLMFDDAWLTFYIKLENGFQLPKFMQWLKQTFSFRFNVRTGRRGHLWGLRYESWIIDGEPPPGAKLIDWDAVKAEAAKEIPIAGTYTLTWDSLRQPEMRLTTQISLKNPANRAFLPGQPPRLQQKGDPRHPRQLRHKMPAEELHSHNTKFTVPTPDRLLQFPPPTPHPPNS
jgi:hypothetical protein